MNNDRTKGLSVVAEAVTVTVPQGPGSEPKTLLKDVTLEIEPGEFICVLGPSGAGKSTLVRAILGERAIAAGRMPRPRPTRSGAQSATSHRKTSTRRACRWSGRSTSAPK
jgi:ABC-type nitrate/sulfonate/bicarbonate transport system ATPase subunit